MRKFQANIDVQALTMARVELDSEFGATMLAWSNIERFLYHWFAGITAMPDGMARAIFYSARSFNARAEMLEAAIEYAHKQTPAEIAFIKEAIKKARQFSEFRNRMAHGEARLTINPRDPKDVHYKITQGKNVERSEETAITITDLRQAQKSFKKLFTLLMGIIPQFRDENGLTAEQALPLVRELPNQPNKESGPTVSEPETEPPRPHRNKKAHREAQKAKKSGG